MRRQGGLWCPLVVLLLLWAGAAWAEVCKGSKVPKAELRRYDAQATLSSQDTATALATHLPGASLLPPQTPTSLRTP